MLLTLPQIEALSNEEKTVALSEFLTTEKVVKHLSELLERDKQEGIVLCQGCPASFYIGPPDNLITLAANLIADICESKKYPLKTVMLDFIRQVEEQEKEKDNSVKLVEQEKMLTKSIIV